jgi:hypothetical protein
VKQFLAEVGTHILAAVILGLAASVLVAVLTTALDGRPS